MFLRGELGILFVFDDLQLNQARRKAGKNDPHDSAGDHCPSAGLPSHGRNLSLAAVRIPPPLSAVTGCPMRAM